MLFQRFMTGRGVMGYGFHAQTQTVPQTDFQLQSRDKDTGDSQRPSLELLTTRYGEFAAVGSYFDREQKNGYSDFLFPDKWSEAEREALLENPGRLLYLPHVDKKTFLGYSGHNSQSYGLGKDVSLDLPSIPHKYEGRFNLSKAVLADLVADLWFASSSKFSRKNGKLVHIRLTDASESGEFLDIAREFYCNVLIPALPKALRPLISVTIGKRFADVKDCPWEGVGALAITIPDNNELEMVPGTYSFVNGSEAHQSLNPFGDEKLWRSFGEAILYYNTGTPSKATGTNQYLADFFSTVEALGPFSCTELLSNVLIANVMDFTAHKLCADVREKTGDFSSSVPAEKCSANFNENVWEMLILFRDLIQEKKSSQIHGRTSYAWLERDVMAALLSDSRLPIDQEKYQEICKWAFSVKKEINDPEMVSELETVYDSLLLRETGIEGLRPGNLWLQFLSEGNYDPEAEADRLIGITKQALGSEDFQPSDEHLRILADFASRGDRQSRVVSEYAADLLNKGYSLTQLRGIRKVQIGGILDSAVLDWLHEGDNISLCNDSDFRAAFRIYAESEHPEDAHSAVQMKRDYGSAAENYISGNVSEFRPKMASVYAIFNEAGLTDSPEMSRAICACLKNGESPLTESDVQYALIALRNPQTSEQAREALLNLFEETIPTMFEQNRSSLVIDPAWSKLVKPSEIVKKTQDDQWQEGLRSAISKALAFFVAQNNGLLSTKMNSVQNAFSAFGYSPETNEDEASSLCECASGGDGPLEQEEADILLPVLRSSQPAASRLNTILQKRFTECIPDMIDLPGDKSCESFRKCFEDKNPSEAQKELKNGMNRALLKYVDENPAECTLSLKRISELSKTFGGGSTAQDWQNVLCKLMSERAGSDAETKLRQEDLSVLGENKIFMSGMSEETKDNLVSSLKEMFKSDLKRMTTQDDALGIWKKLLTNEYVGDALKKQTAEIVHAFVMDNSEELDNPAVVMKTYAEFGGSRSQQMKGWLALLSGSAKNKNGAFALTSQLLATMKQEVFQVAEEEDLDALTRIFSEDLPAIVEDPDYELWSALTEKTSGAAGRLWKEKSKEAFVAYLREQKTLAEKKSGEDLLNNILVFAGKMKDWEKDESICESITAYYAALERDTLSQKEAHGLLSLYRRNSTELGKAIQENFRKAIPSLLEGTDELTDRVWRETGEKIDLAQVFSKEVPEVLKSSGNGEKGENINILPCLSLGSRLNLCVSASKEAIKIVRTRKISDGVILSEQENEELQKIILETQNNELLFNYVDLMDQEPDASDDDGRNQYIKNQMNTMRSKLLPSLNQEVARHIAIKRKSPWKELLNEAILKQVKSAVTRGEKSFTELCALPERWKSERGYFRYVEYQDLTTYVSPQDLKDNLREEVRKIIDGTSLEDLKQNPFIEESGWLPELVVEQVGLKVKEGFASLADQCDTPEKVVDLMNFARQYQISPETLPEMESLNFILSGKGIPKIADLRSKLGDMKTEETKEISLNLLRRACFEDESGVWAERWNVNDITDGIPVAALCCFGTKEKNWEAFFNIVLSGFSTEKESLAQGVSLPQAILFANKSLAENGFATEAENLPDRLRDSSDGRFWSMAHGSLRGRKAYAPLKDPETWKHLGLPDSLRELLF